jgi:RNA polymerase-binding protein DksA
MERTLLALKEEIFQHLAQESEDFRKLIEDKEPKDLADIASSDIDRTTLQALEMVEVRRLGRIEAALVRIKNGKYGVCMSCGEKIPRERIEAIPYALLCVKCQANEERRSR